MTTTLSRRFALPLFKRAPARSIVPFFMPFAGCAIRCIFCAQDLQTGQAQVPLALRLQNLEQQLAFPASGTERELAFYGGTFTRLDPTIQETCLRVAQKALVLGHIVKVRCSTRPDAVCPEQLVPLRESGLKLIELGIQSFQNKALQISYRGYDKNDALQGCRTVLREGFELGIQLLPGMPGLTKEAFLDDVDTALSLAPSCLRFYPCLVLKGTALATLWKDGHYQPWSLEETVTTLGEALRRAWRAGVPVIRMGLAPEPSLEAAFLDGPRHPALGSLVQGEALLRTVEIDLSTFKDVKAFQLHLPSACQGFLYGHQGSLKPRWAHIGLSQVIWHSENHGEWISV